LLEPLILFLLVADVSSDGLFVPPDRVDEKSPGPKVLPHEVALALSIDPGQMDRALALDIPNHKLAEHLPEIRNPLIS
jgi:hypothetical protein